MRRLFLMLALLVLAACGGQQYGGTPPSRNFAGLTPSSANCYDSGSQANYGSLAAAGALFGSAIGQSGFERFAGVQSGAAYLSAATPPRYDGCNTTYERAQPQFGGAGGFMPPPGGVPMINRRPYCPVMDSRGQPMENWQPC